MYSMCAVSLTTLFPHYIVKYSNIQVFVISKLFIKAANSISVFHFILINVSHLWQLPGLVCKPARKSINRRKLQGSPPKAEFMNVQFR
jgi:hypothetical protein